MYTMQSSVINNYWLLHDDRDIESETTVPDHPDSQKRVNSPIRASQYVFLGLYLPKSKLNEQQFVKYLHIELKTTRLVLSVPFSLGGLTK